MIIQEQRERFGALPKIEVADELVFYPTYHGQLKFYTLDGKNYFDPHDARALAAKLIEWADAVDAIKKEPTP